MTDQQFKHKQRIVKKYRTNLTKEATKSELVMKSRLERMGIGFLFQKGFIKDKGFYIIDFYLPKHKLCIEVDGSSHFNKKGIDRDHWKNQYLTKDRGFGILRITNSETWRLTDSAIYDLIKNCARGEVNYSDGYFIPKCNAR